MIASNRYFCLCANSMNACSMVNDARDKAQRTWACPEGPHPKPDAEVLDVYLQEPSPRDKPLNFVMFGGIPVVHRELLDLFGSDNIARDLYIGRVYGRRGKLLEDWVTARGRHRLVLRGSPKAGYRVCEWCGRVLYSATGDRYLFPAPPKDVMIFESSLFGFVVTHEIAERIVARKWRRMSVDPLPVLDEPLDGLGLLPAG
jgi:hypothetical protein